MKKALVAAALLVASQAQAAIIFDTMRGPFDWRILVGADIMTYTEIAVPFRVRAPGHITRLETLISVEAGEDPLVVGIGTSALFSEPPQSYQTSLWTTTICTTVEPCIDNIDPFNPAADHYLQPGQMFSTDLSLLVQPGEYFLHVGFMGDRVFGDWHLSSIESENWLFRTEDSNGWQGIHTADDEGIPWTLPAARIHFSAVSEPGSFAITGLALMLLAMVRSGRQRKSS